MHIQCQTEVQRNLLNAQTYKTAKHARAGLPWMWNDTKAWGARSRMIVRLATRRNENTEHWSQTLPYVSVISSHCWRSSIAPYETRRKSHDKTSNNRKKETVRFTKSHDYCNVTAGGKTEQMLYMIGGDLAYVTVSNSKTISWNRLPHKKLLFVLQ